MKLAAIADIHGNCLALEAVLADIAALGIGEVVNLGDHLSGPLEARRTADLLMERGIASIRGDQDRIMVELGAPGASRRIDHRQLEQSHLDWLASLPPTLLHRDEIFLCHGSPKSDSAFWLERLTEEGQILSRPIAEIESEAVGVEASLILCGHSHLPRAVRLRDGRLAVNPGSVGCPGYDSPKPVYHKGQTGTPDACYAILERSSRGWSTTFRYVPYDHMPMAELAQRNGLPVWAAALATGWVE